MATASHNLCRSLRQVTRSTPAKRKCIAQCRRPFSISFHYKTPKLDEVFPKPPPPSRHEDPVLLRNMENDHENWEEAEKWGGPRVSDEVIQEWLVMADPQPSQYMSPEIPLTLDDLTPDERAEYEALAPEKQSDYLAWLNHGKAVVEHPGPEMDEELSEKLITRINRAYPMELAPRKATTEKSGMGYWAEDEEDELGQYPDEDDEWDPSMITSVAENELQLHREIRQYTRAVAWEMPLLTKLAAKDFEAPTLSTPLRFRYTTYMGESHPAARKVVVEFTSQDLMKSISLTEPQRLKLTKLLGPRYNPHTDVARMSCERFDHAAQNKRYLGDLVNSLITSAKDSSDMFEDVPRDDRHAKVKTRIPFPENWLLKESRVKQLADARKPKDETTAVPRIERDAASQNAIADYMAKMPLGRRQATWAEAQKEPQMEPVRVR